MQRLKKLIPRSLYGRFLLIVTLSAVIVQLVSIYVFYYTHLDVITKHMARSVVAEMVFVKKSELNEIVEKSLTRAGLWDEVKDRLNDQASGLSGGQQQRLCIARTIAIEPEVILMDEPCSALDPIATAKIEELIDELKENFTIIIVTHSMQQAARVSDRTAFFNMGKIVEFDTTDKIFTNPSNQQTQDYITGRFG